ncbi:hypothetical protein EJV47_05825 [Hymenobacter gummosus]|uniref:Uncharacterized protein n=1 Tax=Hymenobacter gummosus TaxID=1776032 RepID=A0A3S0IR90_9BACT|nr:hypothetical protein [Hymenobacter gummosus]RTQ52528.1 hypothetical protein EJV47_05825 [Hymenobacter gummosus]
MQKHVIDPKSVPGWGIDADPQNDPTYPMKPNRTDVEQQGYTWERPTQQPADVEVLHSIERPNLSAVFGTASPPVGLSGMIRRWAFRWSENEYNHWLPLILADRVNVVEGIIEDIAHGKFPNIWKEKGYNASWKHDRTGLVLRLAAFTAVAGGLVLWLSADGGKKKAKRQKHYRGAYYEE